MKMRTVLGLIAIGLSARATFAKIQYSLERLTPVSQQSALVVGFTDVPQAGAVAGNLRLADRVTNGQGEQQYFPLSDQIGHRRLEQATARLTVLNWSADAKLTFSFEMKNADGDTLQMTLAVITDADGDGSTTFSIDDSYFEQGAEVTSFELVSCEATICTNAVGTGKVSGDPHMVGLLGQKIDWAGVDNAWYCLLSDGPNFHVNVRLSAPMPEEFPDRQLISAVSILTADGLHSLVIDVKNPYSTDTDGCPRDTSVPCLADGGIRVLVDGQEYAALEAPTENARLPGISPVIFSAANLPAECRPFGGDRIWATQFADMTTNRRNLRSDSDSFEEWILQPDTLAAPTWCAKFLKEEGSTGLLSTRSEHATLRVETPVTSVRINVGVNYQDLETAPDGTVLVPELDFWQTDLGFDDLRLSDDVTGLMGDTSRFVLDDEGDPVTGGLGALHGPVESYRVTGPFAREFEMLHQ